LGQAKTFTKIVSLKAKRKRWLFIVETMFGVELLQVDVLMRQEELVTSQKSGNKPHGYLRVLISNKFAVESKTLEPESETALVVGERFIRALNDFTSRGCIETWSASAMDMREVQSKQLV
jgi:hypothetical protein